MKQVRHSPFNVSMPQGEAGLLYQLNFSNTDISSILLYEELFQGKFSQQIEYGRMADAGG